MIRTTVYLPEELKRRLERTARDRRVSEAEIIRAAIDHFTSAQGRPRPRLPLFDSGRGDIAERVDEILGEGFGRD